MAAGTHRAGHRRVIRNASDRLRRDPVRFFDPEIYARTVDTVDAAPRVISAAHAPLALDLTGSRTAFALTTSE